MKDKDNQTREEIRSYLHLKAISNTLLFNILQINKFHIIRDLSFIRENADCKDHDKIEIDQVSGANKSVTINLEGVSKDGSTGI